MSLSNKTRQISFSKSCIFILFFSIIRISEQDMPRLLSLNLPPFSPSINAILRTTRNSLNRPHCDGVFFIFGEITLSFQDFYIYILIYRLIKLRFFQREIVIFNSFFCTQISRPLIKKVNIVKMTMKTTQRELIRLPQFEYQFIKGTTMRGINIF